MAEYFYRKTLGREKLYEGGPDLFTLHLLYVTFGLTPLDVKNMPEDEAQLLSRYAHQLRWESMQEGRLCGAKTN
jgi:hypothetical protein